MGTQQQEQDWRNEVVLILEKQKKLSKDDLQALRERTIVAPWLSGKKDAFSWRMDIELIDAIRSLDETSSFLATVGIVVAIVGALFTLLQVLIAIKVLPLK
jgi:hypothetical protein